MARRSVAALIGIVPLAFFLGGFVTYKLITAGERSSPNAGQPVVPLNIKVDPRPISDPGAIARAAATVEPSVVTIDTSIRTRVLQEDGAMLYYSPQTQEVPLGTGSGVILTADGIIVTNNHVVQNATRIKVTLSDGRELQGQVLGSDAQSDLAVVRVDAKNLPAATLADSDQVKVGEWVVAVGDPLRVGTTVTAGIVSALRKNKLPTGLGGSLAAAIQTDAAINPGNSGGALADIDGRLIGINTAILSPNGGSIGIGFAIPANVVRALVPQLIAQHRIAHPWLGIGTLPLDDDMREQLNAPADLNGVVVGRVAPGSPADEAGLQVNDIIQQAQGRPVTTAEAIQSLVQSLKVGDPLSLQVWRAGDLISLMVHIQEKPATATEMPQQDGQQEEPQQEGG
jgi:S1-C subfamily serine protease